MTAYLFIFNTVGGASVEAIGKFFNSRDEVRHWITGFSHGMIVISDKSTAELQQLIHGKFPETWFLIDPIEPIASNGWMPQLFWDWINNPNRPITPLTADPVTSK
jgi:hypothetical protein